MLQFIAAKILSSCHLGNHLKFLSQAIEENVTTRCDEKRVSVQCWLGFFLLQEFGSKQLFAIYGHCFILYVPEKIFANVVILPYSACGVKRWFSGEFCVFRGNVLLVENTWIWTAKLYSEIDCVPLKLVSWVRFPFSPYRRLEKPYFRAKRHVRCCHWLPLVHDSFWVLASPRGPWRWKSGDGRHRSLVTLQKGVKIG